jgi:hypothetical protein
MGSRLTTSGPWRADRLIGELITVTAGADVSRHWLITGVREEGTGIHDARTQSYRGCSRSLVAQGPGESENT